MFGFHPDFYLDFLKTALKLRIEFEVDQSKYPPPTKSHICGQSYANIGARTGQVLILEKKEVNVRESMSIVQWETVRPAELAELSMTTAFLKKLSMSAFLRISGPKTSYLQFLVKNVVLSIEQIFYR